MNFDRSTQSRSWLFDETSLLICRKKITSFVIPPQKTNATPVSVRRFASGFCNRQHAGDNSEGISNPSRNSLESSDLSSEEQEIIVRFHAHQLEMLIGPCAFLPSLRRSSTVLATAIIFFRRFYLSNSVLDFQPRKIAIAAAFLASKVEEQRVQAHILQHATEVIHSRVKEEPLCNQELTFVTNEEILASEKLLLSGINYEMRCHHPYDAIRILSSEIEKFTHRDTMEPGMQPRLEKQRPRSSASSCEVKVCNVVCDDFENSYEDDALLIAQNALIFSDAPFLFPPGQIAFAAMAIAMRKEDDTHLLPLILRNYLRERFTKKSEIELQSFEQCVSVIVQHLEDSPIMDVKMIELSKNTLICDRVVADQAKELCRVCKKVSTIRDSSTTKGVVVALEPRKRLPELTTFDLECRTRQQSAKITPVRY